MICDLPLTVERGRRPVTNGHLVSRLALVANCHIVVGVWRIRNRAAIADIFGLGIVPVAQEAWTSRP